MSPPGSMPFSVWMRVSHVHDLLAATTLGAKCDRVHPCHRALSGKLLCPPVPQAECRPASAYGDMTPDRGL